MDPIVLGICLMLLAAFFSLRQDGSFLFIGCLGIFIVVLGFVFGLLSVFISF